MTLRCLGLCCVLLSLSASHAWGQMTRKQVMTAFYMATAHSDRGEDSLAIAVLDKIMEAYPRLPNTYLRQAQIYDAMIAKGDPHARSAAVMMYRRYLSLELDEAKTASVSTRLRQLEDELKIAHYEDLDDELGRQELSASNKKAIPVIMSDDAAEKASASVGQQTAPAEQPAAMLPLLVGKQQPVAEEPAPAVPAAGRTETAPSVARAQAAPDCATVPLSGQSGISYLEFYDLEIPTRAVSAAHSVLPMAPTALAGHWVSSRSNSDGRERWIFDIEPFGTNCSVSLNSEAGVLNLPQATRNFYSSIVDFLQRNEVLGNTTIDISCGQVEGMLTANNSLVFAIESERNYKPSTTIYSWGHTILESLSTVLPFCGMICTIGDNWISKQEQKDVETTFTLESKFECQLIAKDVLECRYSAKEKRTTSKGSKYGKPQMETFYLYRTPASYTYFSPLDFDLDDEDENGRLLERVRNDALADPAYNYPLAELYRYGVGTEESDAEAFAVMADLANRRECSRAMAWLATQYFNAAYDRTEDLSRSTRRKYLKASDYWMKRLRRTQSPAWYALRGDIIGASEDAKADSAVHYYKQGAFKGDAYACYKLGLCAKEGQGTTKSLQDARRYLQQAADQNYADAWLELARLSLLETTPDMDAYLSNLSKAIDLGSADAFAELATAYLQGYGVERDFNKANLARELHSRARRNGWQQVLALYGYDISAYK